MYDLGNPEFFLSKRFSGRICDIMFRPEDNIRQDVKTLGQVIRDLHSGYTAEAFGIWADARSISLGFTINTFKITERLAKVRVLLRSPSPDGGTKMPKGNGKTMVRERVTIAGTKLIKNIVEVGSVHQSKKGVDNSRFFVTLADCVSFGVY